MRPGRARRRGRPPHPTARRRRRRPLLEQPAGGPWRRRSRTRRPSRSPLVRRSGRSEVRMSTPSQPPCCARSAFLSTFPSALRGSVATDVSDFGILYRATRPSSLALTSPRLTSAPSLGTTMALPTSPQRGVGHPDDGHLGNRRELHEDALDLGREHALTAGLEHVLEAVGDEDVPVVVPGRPVAGAEPPPVERLLGTASSPVARRHTGPVQPDLAWSPRGYVLARLIDQSHPRVHHRQTARPDLPHDVGGRKGSCRRSHLGAAVVLLDAETPFVPPL